MSTTKDPSALLQMNPSIWYDINNNRNSLSSLTLTKWVWAGDPPLVPVHCTFHMRGNHNQQAVMTHTRWENDKKKSWVTRKKDHWQEEKMKASETLAYLWREVQWLQRLTPLVLYFPPRARKQPNLTDRSDILKSSGTRWNQLIQSADTPPTENAWMVSEW